MFNLENKSQSFWNVLDTTKFNTAGDSKKLITQYSLKFVRIVTDYSIENVSSIIVIHNYYFSM
jgi:hypothetical protein